MTSETTPDQISTDSQVLEHPQQVLVAVSGLLSLRSRVGGGPLTGWNPDGRAANAASVAGSSTSEIALSR
jgi:hypothetical protein